MSEINKANILKIDVEGFEKSVLEGAKNLLSSPDLRLIVLENPDEEIISLLNGYGFSQCRYNAQTKVIKYVKDKQHKQNGIFIRK